MDIDYIILRELPVLKFTNFLVIEGVDGELLNNGVLHFNAGHRLVKAWIDSIASNYDPEDYYLHGPTTLSQVYSQMCTADRRTRRCPDVKLVTYKYFCPIGAPFWELIFQNASEHTINMVKSSYGIHLWNSLSGKKEILLGTTQLYAVIAQGHCPHCVRSKMEERML